jgi:glycosyltransferase involved in cell wall biosynthesis
MIKLDMIVPISNLSHLPNIFTWNSRKYGELRLILIHDAVREDCGGKCREVISKEDALIVKCGNFGNPGSARNAGLELSSSSWVCFADSDDYPQISEILLACGEAESRNKKYICGQANVRKVSNNKVSRLGNSYWEIAMNPGIWRFVFRRSTVFPITFPKLNWGEDQVYLAKTLNVGFEQLHQTDRVLYEYRLGVAGQLTARTCHSKDLLRATDEELLMIEQKSLNGISKRIVPLMLIRKIATYIKWKGMDAEAIVRIKRSFGLLGLNFILVLVKFLIFSILNKIKLRVL